MPASAKKHDIEKAQKSLTRKFKKALSASLATLEPAQPEAPSLSPTEEIRGIAGSFLNDGEILATRDWFGDTHGATTAYVAGDGRAWTRLVPAHDAKLTARRLRDASGDLKTTLPFAFGNNGDGADTERGLVKYQIRSTRDVPDGAVRATSDLIQYFSTGEVWVLCGVLVREGIVDWRSEDLFAWSSRQFAEFAKSANLLGPFRIMFGVSGTKGSRFIVPGSRRMANFTFARDEIRHEAKVDKPDLPALLVEARRAAERLWEEAGIERPNSLDTAASRQEEYRVAGGWWEDHND